MWVIFSKEDNTNKLWYRNIYL